MCQVLGVLRSGYYAWRKKPKSKRQQANEHLLQAIKQVHKTTPVYGYPRVTAELKASGITCSKNRVARLMRENQIAAKVKRKFKATTNSRHNLPVVENHLNRNFNPKRLNVAWAADITYIPTREGWLYLAAVEDLYSRKIIGWAMDKTMTEKLVHQALLQAIKRVRPPKGVVHHSDRGSQYASKDYQALLRTYGFIPSMSRKGDCYDNACVESFFGTLKKELVYFHRYRTRAEARTSIFRYIELFYNRVRLHSKLGYKSPEDYEKLSLAA
jgi:putative transposase